MLSREQAEAAGWTLSKGGTNASNHAVGVYSVRPTNVLSAIAAIESYPACVALLEEAAVLLIAYRRQCVNADYLKDLGDSLLAKLEVL